MSLFVNEKALNNALYCNIDKIDKETADLNWFILMIMGMLNFYLFKI